MKQVYSWLLLLFAILVAGCQKDGATAQGGQAGLTTPTLETTPEVATQPALPSPTVRPATVVSVLTPTNPGFALPAPLYFVSAQTEQFSSSYSIMRLERDGQTVTPIVSAWLDQIRGFDVSPIDGSIVFATQGCLWLSIDGDVSYEPLLVGLPNPEGTEHYEVMDPVWSPDGRQIAYADNGIAIFDTKTQTSTVVVENKIFGEIRFGMRASQIGIGYSSPRWSPDGTSLIFQEQTPTSPSWKVFQLNGNRLNTIPGSLGVWGNNISWNADGTALLLDYFWPGGTDIPGLEPAFVQVQLDTLEVEALWLHTELVDSSGTSYPVLYPFQGEDGRILFFQAEPCDSPCQDYSLMEGAFTEDGFVMQTLRQKALPEGVDDAVWHESGRFVAFLTSTGGTWRIVVMDVESGQTFVVAEEEERPWPIVWGR